MNNTLNREMSTLQFSISVNEINVFLNVLHMYDIA